MGRNYNILAGVGNPRSQATLGTGYQFVDSDASAYNDAVETNGGSFTDTEKEAVDNLVIDLKANSLYTNLVALYPMIGASAESMAINTITPGTFDLIFANTVADDFTATGWRNTATSNARTGVIPNDNMGDTDGSLYAWYFADDTLNVSNQHIIGVRDGTSSGSLANMMHLEASDDFFRYRYFTSGSTTARVRYAASFGDGLWSTSHTAGGAAVYQKGSLAGSDGGSRSFPVKEIYLGTFNNNGSPFAAGTENEFRFAALGSNRLDATENTNLNTAVETFQTSLSRQVG